MASTAEALPPKAGPSLVIQLGALVMMTTAAAGMGWLSGGYLTGETPAAGAHAPAVAHAPAAAHEAAGEHGEVPGGEQPGMTVMQLAGITTNLAAPSDVWVRLELSIVLDQPADPGLADLVQQDLLAFVRTVKMHQIEGASGFQHFKADLQERAAIRSGGHVKQVLIRTLLYE